MRRIFFFGGHLLPCPLVIYATDGYGNFIKIKNESLITSKDKIYNVERWTS